jgi:hypothetical protein
MPAAGRTGTGMAALLRGTPRRGITLAGRDTMPRLAGLGHRGTCPEHRRAPHSHDRHLLAVAALAATVTAGLGGGVARQAAAFAVARGLVVIRALYPALTPAQASDIIVPHRAGQAEAAQERAAYDGATSPTGGDAPH